MTKQMIDFQKTTFDNTFNAMVLLQEQSERMGRTVLQQASWLPEDGKKAIDEWISGFKKARDEFKNVIDDSYNKMISLFSETQASEE